jgi:hypothetical protein
VVPKPGEIGSWLAFSPKVIAGWLLTNPVVDLWVSGARTWVGAAQGLSSAEMLCEQARMMQRITAQAVCLWSGAWMFPPPKTQTVAERMAALSLRVVVGERR